MIRLCLSGDFIAKKLINDKLIDAYELDVCGKIILLA